MKKLITIHLIALFPLFAFTPAVSTDPGGDIDEYMVRAAVMVKLINYMDWSDKAVFKKQNLIFRFGILGAQNPFGTALEKFNLERKVKDRFLEVVQYDTPSSLDSPPDVLYVPKGQKALLEEVAVKLAGKPCLVVSEESCTVEKNAGLGMYIGSTGKLSIDLNPSNLESIGMTYGSEVLGLVAKQ